QHVLEEVRHALLVVGLRHCAGLHHHFDGGERHGVVLEDDHVHAVGERLLMGEPLERCALCEKGGGNEERSAECAAQHGTCGVRSHGGWGCGETTGRWQSAESPAATPISAGPAPAARTAAAL